MLHFFTETCHDPDRVQLLQEIKEVNAALQQGFVLGYSEKDWNSPFVWRYVIQRIVIDADNPMTPPRSNYNSFRYGYELGFPGNPIHGIHHRLLWPAHRSPGYLLIHALRQVRAGQHDHTWDGWGLNQSCIYCFQPGPKAERRIEALTKQQQKP